ncbi:MAG TPA: hypothetical protein VF071_01325 [Candidatus Limnocylindria bacterium]
MRRISRFIMVVVTLGLVVAAMPSSASAQIEDWQRVIRARHAGAVFVQVNGCDQVEIYVSSSDGKYVNRHGAVNKQGLLGVLYIVRDACAEPGPKGYPVTYSADGMSLDSLVTPPRFERASVVARLPGTDDDGNPVLFRVDLQWRPTAVFEKSRVSGHAWFPPGEKRGAWIGTWSHNWMAPAVAWGTVWLDGRAITLQPTVDATLEQVRYMCKVIQHPQGGAELDC